MANLDQKAEAKKSKQAADVIKNENDKNFTFQKSLTVKEISSASKKPQKILNTKEE